MQAFKFSTANVETLMGRSAGVVDMLSRRKVDVAGLQEVRYWDEDSERRGCCLQIVLEW